MSGVLTRDRDDDEADRAAQLVIPRATDQEGPVSGDLLPRGAEHRWVDDRSEGSKQVLISGVLVSPVPDLERLAEREHRLTIRTCELGLCPVFLDGPGPRVSECVSA